MPTLPTEPTAGMMEPGVTYATLKSSQREELRMLMESYKMRYNKVKAQKQTL